MVDRRHEFGGDWTERKLAVVTGYLPAYLKVFKAHNFKLAYIDAFAGSGYRSSRRRAAAPLLDALGNEIASRSYDGSARLALQTSGFYRYIFIDRSRQRCAEL